MYRYKTRHETPHILLEWQHEWKIGNYKEVLKFIQDQGTKGSVTGPLFNIFASGFTRSGNSFNKLAFCLELFPVGEPGHENTDTALFISNRSLTKLEMKYVLSILKDDEKIVRLTKPDYRVFNKQSPHNSWGSKKFLKPDLVDDHVSADGSLVIFIELEILLQSINGAFVKQKKNPTPDIVNLKRLREDPLFSDMQLKCQGETFHVHKNILSLCSPVFKAMLSDKHLVEGRTSCVEIQDTDSSVIRNLIDFIYTGNTECLKEDTLEILAVANKYDFQEVKQECEIILTSNLTSENAIDYLNLASLHEAKSLKEAALEFVASNVSSVGKVIATTPLDDVKCEVWKELFVKLVECK